MQQNTRGFKMNSLPKHYAISFENNPQTGCYVKTPYQPSKQAFKTVPFELVVEQTQSDSIKPNAGLIIRGKEKGATGKEGNNPYKFFAGLIPTSYQNCFVSNDYKIIKGVKVTSLTIFRFSADNSKLHVFYFPNFDKADIEERIAFADRIMPVFMQLYNIKGH